MAKKHHFVMRISKKKTVSLPFFVMFQIQNHHVLEQKEQNFFLSHSTADTIQ